MLRDTPRSIWVAALWTTAVAATCCTQPLFDVLGYEFAFALGLASVPAGLVTGLALTRSERWWRSLVVSQALLLLPSLVLVTLNGLRVQNCDWWEGLCFFALLPLASSVYATTLGALVGLLDRRWMRGLGVALVAVGSLGLSLWRLFFEPPIFVYNHLWGYFAGSIYDESLNIDATLLAFRGGTLLRLALLAGCIALARSLQGNPLPPRGIERGGGLGWGARSAAVAIALCFGSSYDLIVGARQGFLIDRLDILGELSDTETLDGLVMHMPPLPPATRAALVEDHAFRLQQLQARLGIRTHTPIHSFVYRDADQKARLMGGRHTMIAKPWLHELHIHGTSVPHDVLAHELVHALAAEYGGPLGVSISGAHIHLGLIEGLAEAVTPPRGASDLHTAAAILRQSGHAPDLARAMGMGGFWTTAPRRAYAYAGSFVSFLIARHGPERLLTLYPHADFEGAYGRTLPALILDWERYLDGLSIPEREVPQAQETFRRPSMFQRVCAREIAQLRDHARKATGDERVALNQRVVSHLGTDDARFELARTLFLARRPEFSPLAAELLERGGLSVTQRAELWQSQAEALARAGSWTLARTAVEKALALRTSLEQERLLWVWLWALDLPEDWRTELARFLGRELKAPSARDLLQRVIDATPLDPTPVYLLARQEYLAHRDASARTLLSSITHTFLPIEAERLRLLAELTYRQGRHASAADAYTQYAAVVPVSGERARALDWADRAWWQNSLGVGLRTTGYRIRSP